MIGPQFDRDIFTNCLSALIPVTQTDCFAWALIPNHAHLLLRTGSVPRRPFYPDDDVKIAKINQLQLAAGRYSTIGAFPDYTDGFQDEAVADDKEGVSLMTVQKAKGLEFPVAFVIDCIEELMPSGKGNLEEERRICFMAISRAMYLLFLFYPLNYLGQPAKKSIFLDVILGNRQPATNKPAA